MVVVISPLSRHNVLLTYPALDKVFCLLTCDWTDYFVNTYLTVQTILLTHL